MQLKDAMITLLAGLALIGCSDDGLSGTNVSQSVPPALVAIVSVRPESVTVIDELPGRVAAYRTAEIRPQVGGIVEKRLFQEGSEVHSGQELYQLSAAPFKAEVDSAAAVLQRADAALIRSQAKYDRAKQLIETKAISRDNFEEAVANLAQAKANVAEARASLQRRKLDLEFATVRAPISGRIGHSMVSEGALVSVSSTGAMGIIQQIDKVFVDVRQPASQLDVIREAADSGQLHDPSNIPVEILSASGKRYPVAGKALFSEISVDPGTGNVTVRVEVNNPDDVLLPGMFVRARLPRGVRSDALLVPQQAIIRDPLGHPQLLVLSNDKTAVRRPIEIGETVDGRTIVTTGLRAGDVVVVQGQDRVQEGVPVQTTDFVAPLVPGKN
ncbi:efflux RND transporter periplasmic adaptor subunit [Brucella intermedia]|uniref:efflux RND transporter periplasmic adaptor subunit n=1 Tax=Brucella intermedia TaxID=94625 RepID=UPI00224A9CA9|nr:efflux RND transporter periplasmic adaptor subunit [Brucella intermedia]